ncbi:MAG: tetratricopeptide (TPR) repeat protein [Saprospiraceae bacterium]|jgi:tetratricopeptide (TPR) repeat protein
MKRLRKILISLSLVSLFLMSCNPLPPSKIELSNIDLLRGDIILCSGKKFGEVQFSLSCDISVRSTFDLALSLLHSFQYSEAEKAFVKIIDIDPECAMAYWGVAMSIYHAAWFPPSDADLIKASQILNVAESLDKNTKEQDYLNAINSFYKDWERIDHPKRAKKYEESMQELYSKYSEDTEAAIFYSLALYSTRDRIGKDYRNEKKAGDILENLFDKQPNHPGIAHYIIHNYDNPVLAPMGLEVARRYAEIAPGSSHAQHMPSHIFTRLGLWEESIQSNINSLSAVHCYMEETGMEGHYFEEVHAMDYMVYAYLQKGDNNRAIEQYENLKDIRHFYPMNMSAAVYPVAAIPTRIALENKNWSAAAKLNHQDSDIEWEKYPWHNAIIHFGKALGAAHTKNFNLAEVEIKKLKQLKLNLVSLKDPTTLNQIDQILIQIKTAQAWLNFKRDNQQEGLALMKEAAEMENKTSKHPVTPGDVLPADELLGDMLLAMNRTEEAFAAYEKNLQARPNRFNGVYGAALAAKNSGNEKEAKRYFEHLLKLTASVNSDRPEISEAKDFLNEY